MTPLNNLPRPKQREYKLSIQKIVGMMLWAYNYGKNDGGETSFKREMYDKLDRMRRGK